MVVARQVNEFLWLHNSKDRNRHLFAIMNLKYDLEKGKIQLDGVYNGANITQRREFTMMSAEINIQNFCKKRGGM